MSNSNSVVNNNNTPKTITSEGAGNSMFESGNTIKMASNTNTPKTTVTVNDGQDSFTKEGVETIEIIEPVFVRTEVKIERGREVTYSIYTDEITVRKIDGVIVSTTNK